MAGPSQHEASASATAHQPVLLSVVTPLWLITAVAVLAFLIDIMPRWLAHDMPIGDRTLLVWFTILEGLFAASTLASTRAIRYIAHRTESHTWPLLSGLLALGVAAAMLGVAIQLLMWAADWLVPGASTATLLLICLALMTETGRENGLFEPR